MLQQAIVIKNDNIMPVWWSVIILYKAHHFVLFIISKDILPVFPCSIHSNKQTLELIHSFLIGSLSIIITFVNNYKSLTQMSNQ